MATYLEQVLTKLEEFEGSIPWMYRDTAGHVTVGVGLMLPQAEAAASLPFEHAGVPCSQDEIRAEFRRVDGLPMGRPAMFYRSPESPELPKSEIDALLLRVLTGFEDEVRSRLAGYAEYPEPVRMALLDMAYNLGPGGLLSGYPKMLRAVQAGNWAAAAANCERHGIGAVRNAWTRTMFLSNVLGAVKAEGESALKNLGYGLVGLVASLWSRARKR